MKRLIRCSLVAAGLITLCMGIGQSQEPKAKGKDEFDIVGLGRRLKGRIVDHTRNHGGMDNRIWSKALHQWRDLQLRRRAGDARLSA